MPKARKVWATKRASAAEASPLRPWSRWAPWSSKAVSPWRRCREWRRARESGPPETATTRRAPGVRWLRRRASRTSASTRSSTPTCLPTGAPVSPSLGFAPPFDKLREDPNPPVGVLRRDRAGLKPAPSFWISRELPSRNDITSRLRKNSSGPSFKPSYPGRGEILYLRDTPFGRLRAGSQTPGKGAPPPAHPVLQQSTRLRRRPRRMRWRGGGGPLVRRLP